MNTITGCALAALLAMAPTKATQGVVDKIDRVQRISDMPTPRAAHSATRLGDGRVLIAGGCRDDGCEEGLSSDALLFDPDTRRFARTSPMLEQRVGHRAIPLKDGSVLLIGGWTAKGVTASIERFVPATGKFEVHGRMLQARDGFTATALHDGTILIAGGYADGMRRLADTERYDPRTRRSRTVADMTMPRMSHTATLLADGRVLIAGGSSARGNVTGALEVFDPATSKFSRNGQLKQPRHKHAALLLGRKVMFLGGAAIPENSGHFADTEIWNADTGRIETGPRMREERYKFIDSVIALSDGRALVSGGGRNAEILSKDRSTFHPVPGPIGRKLAFATATPISDGRVLIVGGYDSDIRVNRGAWVFE